MKKKDKRFLSNSAIPFKIFQAVEEQSPSQLFERPPDQAYIDEWAKSLKVPSDLETNIEKISVLVFRLSQEWLALPTIYFEEITTLRPYHHIPHRSNKILLGVVNLNGELKLYIDLNQLLEITKGFPSHENRSLYHQARMVAISKNKNLWVFAVDEIDGIYYWDLKTLENVPVNISKSTAGYMKGIMKLGYRHIGLLDDELLFSSLQRTIL